MNKNKGFTLVEIIVVLVILATLAAITIPSMIGFVQKAKDKQIIPEARAAYTAAQMVATELSAMNNPDNKIMEAITGTENGAAQETQTAKMKSLLGNDAKGQIAVSVENGKVTYFNYTRNNNSFEIISSAAYAEYSVTN